MTIRSNSNIVSRCLEAPIHAHQAADRTAYRMTLSGRISTASATPVTPSAAAAGKTKRGNKQRSSWTRCDCGIHRRTTHVPDV